MNRNDWTISRMKQVTLWSAAVLISFWTMTAAFGQTETSVNSWAVKMFTDAGTVMSHDFGDLALHAEAEQRFRFRNIYKEDVEMAEPQSSCGCTQVTVTKKVVKSGETAEIIARVDTSGRVHIGKRKATITLFFKRPYVAEVQLQVQSFIRSDVVFEPGIVEFGGVGQGMTATKTVYLQYNGNSPKWRVVGLKKTSPSIRAEAKMVSGQDLNRTNLNKTKKTYKIDVQLLPTAEPGYVNDLLHFSINDSGKSGSIFIPIHGLIYSSLSAKPTYLQFGVIHPGESVTKNLVVRGSTPFRIAKVSSNDSRMQFKTANQASVVHVIPVSFSAAATEPLGEFRKSITVKTSLKELPDLEIAAFGIITDKEEDSENRSPDDESVSVNDSVKTIDLAERIDSADSAVRIDSAERIPFTEQLIQSWKEYRKLSDGPALGIFDDDSLTESRLANLLIQKTPEAPRESTRDATREVTRESKTFVSNQEKQKIGIREMGENLRALQKTTKRSRSPQAIENPTEGLSGQTGKDLTKDSPLTDNRLVAASDSSSEEKMGLFRASRPIVSPESPSPGREDAERNETEKGDDSVEAVLSFELPLTDSREEIPDSESETQTGTEFKPTAESDPIAKSKRTVQSAEESGAEEEGWFGVPEISEASAMNEGSAQTAHAGKASPANEKVAMKERLWNKTPVRRSEDRQRPTFRKPTF